MRKEVSFPHMVLGQPDIQKDKTELLPHMMYKNEIKMNGKPKRRAKTLKLLDKNIGQTLSSINNNVFPDSPLGVMTVKPKINK